MIDGLVWIEGRVVNPDEAKVSVFDHGLTVGDGVFETIKVRGGGVPFALTRHLTRLRASAGGLGLELSATDDELRSAIGELLDRWGPEPARLRITVTGGPAPMGSGRAAVPPTLVLAVASMGPPEPVTTVATVRWPRNERGATAGLKTTSYADNVVALAEANRRGATEALLPNTVGNLCEGTGSNVFVVLDGELATPPLSAGCLAGVTRDLVLATGCASERDVPMERLDEVDEVFLTSTTRDVQAVGAIDGRSLGDAPGPLTRAAAIAFAEVAADDDP